MKNEEKKTQTGTKEQDRHLLLPSEYRTNSFSASAKATYEGKKQRYHLNSPQTSHLIGFRSYRPYLINNPK
jgi:hypothetical protein